MYVTGDETQDFINKNEKLILFYVDLENEEIVEKQASQHKMVDEGEGEDEAHQSKHPILLNQYPLCQNHSLFMLFADAGLP